MIDRPKLDVEEYGDIFHITDSEKEAIGAYTNQWYKTINSLLTNNGVEYEKRNGLHNEFAVGNDSKRSEYINMLKQNLERIPLIYSAILKQNLANIQLTEGQTLHRGTSLTEINSLRPGETINRIVSTTAKLNDANWESYMHNENQDAPVHMEIIIEPDSRCPYSSFKRYFTEFF